VTWPNPTGFRPGFVVGLHPGVRVVVYCDDMGCLWWPNVTPKATRRRVVATIVAVTHVGWTRTRRRVFSVDFRLGDEEDGDVWTVFGLVSRSPVELVEEHHPVCAECGEPWPCSHARVDAECVQLDKRIGGAA
jgi:hypothetical protein